MKRVMLRIVMNGEFSVRRSFHLVHIHVIQISIASDEGNEFMLDERR